MASTVITIEVDQLEEDADKKQLAAVLVSELQYEYPYIQITLIEVDGESV